MIDYSTARLVHLALAWVGNKDRYEGVQIPKQTLLPVNDLAEELLYPAMLHPFRDSQEFYRFQTEEDAVDGRWDALPGAWFDCREIFDDPTGYVFGKAATRMASQLYEFMVGSKVMGGEFFIAYFEDLLLDGATVNAIGLWKVQSQVNYFRNDRSDAQYVLNVARGIATDQVEVAALIFNQDEGQGYRVCAIDSVSKKGDRSFWKDAYLKLRPIHDDFYNTRHYISLAHEFVTVHGAHQFAWTRPQQIVLWDRSANYFKDNMEFELDDFANAVFHDQDSLEAFVEHRNAYAKNHGVSLEDSFNISTQAVKKAGPLLKNVLKLDKNFQVQITGRPDLLEGGMDEEKGMRFYKFYYNVEN